MRRHRLPSSRARVLAAMAAGAVTAAVAGAWFLRAAPPPAQVRPPFVAGSPIATGRADLASARAGLQVWLTTHPDDAAAAVRLAELSLREARVTGNAGLVVEASARLRELVARGTRTYEIERMLAALLLSEHRFVEARQMATRLLAHEPNDTWLHGVLGDAALEEGDYEAAFAAFDRMAALRPDAAAYARVAYARELGGDVEGALRVMEMALTASSPHDIEAHAWHLTQLSALQLQLGRLAEARQSAERALYSFANYAPALAARAEVLAAGADLDGAVASMTAAVDQAPAPGWLARLGDFLAARGEGEEAERAYARADAGWRNEAPEPGAHALFLAMRGRDVPRALALAQRATASSNDIVSQEALAWSAFKSGEIQAARVAIERALRTGARSRRLRVHAAAIVAATGDAERARALVASALSQPAVGLEAPARPSLVADGSLGLRRED
jgi:tetratricopeptide (TPR) repeat protein